MPKSVIKISNTLLAIIIVSVLFVAIPAQAKIFELNLYFDLAKNEISLDQDTKEKVITTDKFYSEKQTTSKDYYFKKVNFDSYTSYPFYFTPQNGKFILSVPYFQENSKINIYHQNTLKLSIDVSQFATCNDNNVCETPKGENAQNCIADCFSQEVAKNKNKGYNNSNQNLEPSDPLTGSNNNLTNQSSTTTPVKTPFLGLTVGLIMIVGGAGYGIYRLIKSQRNEE